MAGGSVYAFDSEAKKDSTINIPKARLHRIVTNQDSKDSLITDSLIKVNNESYKKIKAPVDTATIVATTDSIAGKKTEKKLFIPNPMRATWLAVIIPGAGQIYNRKFWKLPIYYGGFVGCAYALTWNNQMYKDYSQAYLDIMDTNPNTNSFLDFLPPNYKLSSAETTRIQNIFKRQKDFYRRNRDLSIFAFIGVYLLSIVDAYVDAELSNFDISQDLSLKVEPAVINDRRGRGNSLGLQCSIKF
ncbi:MAG: DUF5683 domain-containing protein [Bacteroides sp.]